MKSINADHQSLAAQLRERLKELSCLERITKLLSEPDIPLDTLIGDIANTLAPAWQYSDISCSRIRIEGREYTSPNFQESRWFQREDIVIGTEVIGTIEVFYKAPRPPADEGPFLHEERKLLHQVALRLAQAIETHRVQEALHESEHNLRFALEAAGIAAWSVDLQTGEHWRTEIHDRLFGYDTPPADWSLDSFFEHLLPEERQNIQQALAESMMGTEQWEYSFRIRRTDGEIRWIRTQGQGRFDDSGKPVEVFGIMQDVTEQRANAEQTQLAFDALDNIGEGIMVLDREGRVVMVNKAYCQMTQYPREKLLGVIPKADIGDPDRTVFESINAPALRKGPMHGEGFLQRADGSTFSALSSISPVHDDAGEITHYTVVIRDVTDYKIAEDRLQHQAEHDALTGLPNRVLLKDRVQASLLRARRRGHHLTLMALDLDLFKNINDSLGYKTGDELIRRVGEAMRGALKETDTVARTGGDQFAILLDEISTAEDSRIVAQRLLNLLDSPINLAEQEVHITGSIGIACFPENGRDFETLMHHAELAMYDAKAAGRNNFQFFTKGINRDALRALKLQSALHKAAERNEFHLNYQPFVDIATGRITGMEALLRWNNPELGPISPAEFIPLAEESGLICDIGRWVQEEAIHQLALFNSKGHRDLRLAINLSGRQFLQNDLVSSLAATLRREGVSPKDVDVELTESLMMERVDRTIDTLNAFHKLGVTITIDDFGTGYSSLRYLKDFRVNYLKIDKSFIDGIPHDSGDAAIVRTILAIARSMKIKVIAEGIENARQLNSLRKWNCDEAQGFFLSKPIPADAFLQLLDHDRSLC